MATAIGAGWVILFWVVVLLNVWLLWNTIQKVRKHYAGSDDVTEATWQLPSVLGLRVVAFLVLGLALYYGQSTLRSQSESVTRSAPKATVQTSERRSEEVPFVAVSNAPTWDQKMATNRAQNEAARKEFDKLPNKQ